LATPAKGPLHLPSRALAEAIAEEWRRQGDRIRPAEMPLSQFANTALDRAASQPIAVVEGLLVFAATDLVCYRAEAPEALVGRQQRLWQPLLDWLEGRHGTVLAVHRGVLPRPQPRDAIQRLRRHLVGLDPFTLTALDNATRTAGSLVIGLAFVEGRLGPEEAFALSQLDETFQIERWGEDGEAAARRRAIKAEFDLIHRLLQLLREEPAA
jgi:chaperone required for assembly of F1-ATPase